MTTPNRQHLRRLPAVDRVLNLPEVLLLLAEHGRPLVIDWVRDVLAELRSRPPADLPTDPSQINAAILCRLQQVAHEKDRQRLRRIINGTGVVIHTNLGRAPLAKRAIEAVTAAAQATNVEVDLTSGQRGRRGAAVEALCREVTGAEAALIVNNCAAATLLALQALANGRSVVISRGQLIEIGGAFRLPDVFRQAGVRLVEVGTTNRTRLSDYAAAIDADTTALLRVHPSNYRISGFCESVTMAALAGLARQRQLPAIDDVGSGCLYDLTRFGLPDEPIVSESLQAGADLVLFSGDKLLGGPQCGIVVGRAALVDRLRSHPLARALRVDKLTLAALQGTLEIHRAGRAFEEIPVLYQLALTVDDLRARADSLLQTLRSRTSHPEVFSIAMVASAAGGGTLPDLTLPSLALGVTLPGPDHTAALLRQGGQPIVARVQEDRVLIDLRTVSPDDDSLLVDRLTALQP